MYYVHKYYHTVLCLLDGVQISARQTDNRLRRIKIISDGGTGKIQCKELIFSTERDFADDLDGDHDDDDEWSKSIIMGGRQVRSSRRELIVMQKHRYTRDNSTSSLHKTVLWHLCGARVHCDKTPLEWYCLLTINNVNNNFYDNFKPNVGAVVSEDLYTLRLIHRTRIPFVYCVVWKKSGLTTTFFPWNIKLVLQWLI